MRIARWVTAGACAALLWSGGALAAGSDRGFLKQALGVNELELQLARVAAERASTPQLKANARKMLENHTKLGRQLSDLAQQAGLSGNAELTSDQRETLARVESQPASSFDAVFKQTVDAGHVKELAMYQAEVGRASNPQLRALAEQRVTALQQALGGVEQPSKAIGKQGQ